MLRLFADGHDQGPDQIPTSTQSFLCTCDLGAQASAATRETCDIGKVSSVLKLMSGCFLQKALMQAPASSPSLLPKRQSCCKRSRVIVGGGCQGVTLQKPRGRLQIALI